MSVPHSSTPWIVSSREPTIICDSRGKGIVDVRGANEQAEATALHIVECVNADAIERAMHEG